MSKCQGISLMSHKGQGLTISTITCLLKNEVLVEWASRIGRENYAKQ